MQEGFIVPFVKASELFGEKTSANYFSEFARSQLRCTACDEPIKESVTGCRKMGDGGYCCSDCYYKQLGDELETFPVMPRRLVRRP